MLRAVRLAWKHTSWANLLPCNHSVHKGLSPSLWTVVCLLFPLLSVNTYPGVLTLGHHSKPSFHHPGRWKWEWFSEEQGSLVGVCGVNMRLHQSQDPLLWNETCQNNVKILSAQSTDTN